MQLRIFSIFLLSAVACGAAVGEQSDDGPDEVFERSIAGYYSSRFTGNQINPSNTRISVYQFREDGTGELYYHFCDGRRSDVGSFSWLVESSETREISIDFEEDYGGRVGAWIVPEEPCSASSSSSAVDIRSGDTATLWPGRYCNPTLGEETPDGLRTCEFELCDGVSEWCGEGQEG